MSRRVYGGGDEPYQVLTRLGRRLADVPGAQDALPALATGIAEGLRIPYVAVELDLERDAASVTVASAGAPLPDTERFPLVFAGEVIGRLVAAHRTPGERFRPREMALLRDLARHAGIVAHDALLAADLRRSRLDLVVAREEERRRLRGDLHDGPGPTLASVSLGLEAAAARLDDPELVSLLTRSRLGPARRDAGHSPAGLRAPTTSARRTRPGTSPRGVRCSQQLRQRQPSHPRDQHPATRPSRRRRGRRLPRRLGGHQQCPSPRPRRALHRRTRSPRRRPRARRHG